MSHTPLRKESDCLNCGATVQGRYCHACGQENTEPKETIWHMFTHFFYDITHFDGSFFVTLKDLLFKPGFLSKEYMLGRRKKYLHPVRMYVFTSAVFFLVFFSLFYVSEKPTRPGTASQAGSLHAPKERLQHSPMIFPRTTTVQTITLEKWANENAIQLIDLLWLDTQGHELAILQSASNILKNIKVVLAEVSFIESYEDQPQYQDVVTWMASHGFEHVGRDFENVSKSFFGNALFVKK